MTFQVTVSVYITSYLTGTMTSDQGIFLKFALAFDFYRRFFIKYMLSLRIMRYALVQHTHIVVSVNLKIPIFFHETQTVMASLIMPVRKLSIYQ